MCKQIDRSVVGQFGTVIDVKDASPDKTPVRLHEHYFVVYGFAKLTHYNNFGGASRDRTDGLVVANDALSQLSYSPTLA
jgi:hypothetical protein